jgi:hypothetical protein
MGFHKRIINKELILKYIELNKPLKDLFKVEVILFEDNISSMAHELHEKGLTDNQIKIIINENN